MHRHLVYSEICIVVDCRVVFFFQAEDGIRDLVRSRGLGDVYKRQPYAWSVAASAAIDRPPAGPARNVKPASRTHATNSRDRFAAQFCASQSVFPDDRGHAIARLSTQAGMSQRNTTCADSPTPRECERRPKPAPWSPTRSTSRNQNDKN